MKQPNQSSHWNELVRRARGFSMPDEQMPFGFDTAVMRRLAAAGRSRGARGSSCASLFPGFVLTW